MPPRDPLGLTQNQLKIIRYLRECPGRNGYYATVRDVQRYMGWESVATAHDALRVLENKGRLTRKRLTRNLYVYVTVE